MTPPGILASSLYVAIGGGAGSWLRFIAGHFITATSGPTLFPLATLAINVTGSFAMGLLAGWLATAGDDGETWRLLLGVGLLGGFTTFSAFSLEIVHLVERGSVLAAASYASASLAGGVVGLFVGLALTGGQA